MRVGLEGSLVNAGEGDAGHWVQGSSFIRGERGTFGEDGAEAD